MTPEAEAHQRMFPHWPTFAQEMADSFANLGKPEHLGMAFAITRHGIDCNFKSVEALMKVLPRPDYEHGIWLDEVTDNLLVIRPNADGVYALAELTASGSKVGKRLR